MTRPLCIDLYCGLGSSQAEFVLCANPSVQQLMARRAQHPDHVRLGVLEFSPDPVSAELRPVCEFYNSRFATGLAGGRQRRESTTNARHHSGVFDWTAPVVDALGAGVFAMKRAPLLLGGLARAIVGTVAAIAGRRRDVEMPSANPTVAPVPRDVRLLVPPQSADAGLAFERAVSLVRPFRREGQAAA